MGSLQLGHRKCASRGSNGPAPHPLLALMERQLASITDADGTQAGYELSLTRAVAQAVEVPVIASGGAGCIDHIAAALETGPAGGNASAALLASLLHDGVLTVPQIKTDLLARGLAIRPVTAGL